MNGAPGTDSVTTAVALTVVAVGADVAAAVVGAVVTAAVAGTDVFAAVAAAVAGTDVDVVVLLEQATRAVPRRNMTRIVSAPFVFMVLPFLLKLGSYTS